MVLAGPGQGLNTVALQPGCRLPAFSSLLLPPSLALNSLLLLL